MTGQTSQGERRSDPPKISSEGRFPLPDDDQPPDPRLVIEDLRRKLRLEKERSLNATDAVMGARAAAAQAQAESQELFYRLHVKETEIDQLRELLAERAAAGNGGASGGMVGGGNWSAKVQGPASDAARNLFSAVKQVVTD